MQFRFLPLYLIIALFSSGAFFAMTSEAASPSSILVDMSPQNPAPGETVNISLNSYASNLDSVPISWSLDGGSTSSGVGKKTFSLTAPGAGSETRVTVNISLPDGNIQKIIVIRPAIMAMLWQATDSYVPPFYKGKAMPTPDSEIKIVALPEIRNGAQSVNPKNMVYAWKKDYANDVNASGYGKNSYTYINDYLEDSDTVSVIASTTDQKYSSEGRITVRTYQPKVLFYQNDLELGTLWEKALASGHTIQGNEVIEAAPYFISPKDLRIPSLSWEWSINGVYIPSQGIRKNILPVQAQSGASGTSSIKLEINNLYRIFQNTKGELRVTF